MEPVTFKIGSKYRDTGGFERIKGEIPDKRPALPTQPIHVTIYDDAGNEIANVPIEIIKRFSAAAFATLPVENQTSDLNATEEEFAIPTNSAPCIPHEEAYVKVIDWMRDNLETDLKDLQSIQFYEGTLSEKLHILAAVEAFDIVLKNDETDEDNKKKTVFIRKRDLEDMIKTAVKDSENPINGYQLTVLCQLFPLDHGMAKVAINQIAFLLRKKKLTNWRKKNLEEAIDEIPGLRAKIDEEKEAQATRKPREDRSSGNSGFSSMGFDNAGFDNAGFDATGFDNAGFDSTGFDNGFDTGGGNAGEGWGTTGGHDTGAEDEGAGNW